MNFDDIRALWERPKGSHPSWLRVAGIAGLAIVVLLVVGSLTHAHATRERARRTFAFQGQWAGLEGCLLGAPLADGESPSTRFREVQLTVLGTPAPARSTAHEGAWPARCEGFAEGVASHADVVGAGSPELASSARALAVALREDADASADLGRLVDQTWKAAGAVTILARDGKPLEPANPASAPTPTVPMLSQDALDAPASFAGDFDLESVKVDPAPSANVRFLIDDRGLTGGGVLCAASGTPLSLSCERTPRGAGGGLVLSGTTDVNAYPWVFAGDRGQLGIYGPSGALALHGQPAWGASVGPDDSAWLLVHQPGAARTGLGLVLAPRTGDPMAPRSAIEATELAAPSDATLAWTWVVYWGGPRARLPHHLIARAIGGDGLGPAIDIGDAPDLEAAGGPDLEPRFTACRSGDHLALRVHGNHEDAVVFYTGVAWTAPVALRARAGALVCEGDEVVITALAQPGSAPAVEQTRCNAAGCRDARVDVGDLLAATGVMPRGPGKLAAAELDGKLLLVWDAGTLGGLRMRIGATDALKDVHDAVIFDPEGAKAEDRITSLRLVPAQASSLLFVRTLSGVHLFGMDRSGKMAPLSGRL